MVIVGAVCLAVGLTAGLLLAPRFFASPSAKPTVAREAAPEASPPAAAVAAPAPAGLTFVQRGNGGRRVAYAARGLTRVTGAEAAAAADAAAHHPPPVTREPRQQRDGGP
jgi:hypothetical protein